MSQGPTTGNRLQIKKIIFWTLSSGKGHTSQGENVAGKMCLSEYKIPISFQASVATSLGQFLQNTVMVWFSQLRDPVVKGCAWLFDL